MKMNFDLKCIDFIDGHDAVVTVLNLANANEIVLGRFDYIYLDTSSNSKSLFSWQLFRGTVDKDVLRWAARKNGAELKDGIPVDEANWNPGKFTVRFDIERVKYNANYSGKLDYLIGDKSYELHDCLAANIHSSNDFATNKILSVPQWQGLRWNGVNPCFGWV
jgi:hypothetical protein